MSEQMPSHNISYYVDVRRLIPLIYLRFQKIPSVVFPAFFGENHPSDSFFFCLHIFSRFHLFIYFDWLPGCAPWVNVHAMHALLLLIFEAHKVDGLHLPASIAKEN